MLEKINKIIFIKMSWQLLSGLLIVFLGAIIWSLCGIEKHKLIKDIKKLIKYCKSFHSFDEKRDYKTSLWLKLDKEDLRRKSLSELRGIKKEMKSYFKINLDTEYL